MARRYGRLPHEILALDAEDLTLAVLCFQEAAGQAAHRIEQINQHGGMVFPVVDVAG